MLQSNWPRSVVMAIANLFSEVLILQAVHGHAGTPATIDRGLQRHRGHDGSGGGTVVCLHRLASTETGSRH